MAYTSKTNIESYLGVSLDTSLDTFITLMISSVTAFIEQYCGEPRFGKRIFETPTPDDDVTRYFDGNDTEKLPVGDLKSITSLAIDDVVQADGEDYYLKPYNAVLDGKPYTHIELIQPDGRQSSRAQAIYQFDNVQRSVTIVGKWRYSDAVPADITFIATKLVSEILKQNIGEKDLREVKAEDLDDYKIEYADVSKTAQSIGVTNGATGGNAVLDQYKRKVKIPSRGVVLI